MPALSPVVKLNNGVDMPLVGMGLWKIGKDEAPQVIYDAIKVGYRLFDCAADYGNEVEIGKGIAKALADGLVKREELFLVSKLWNTYHEPENVEPACRRSLKDWGLDYFDLYIMHFPTALKFVPFEKRYPPMWHVDDAQTEIQLSNTPVYKTWEAMEALVAKGLAKSIGVSNFQAQSLYELFKTAKIRPATLQVEHHPYLVQPSLMKLAKVEGIQVTAYSSFGPTGYIEMNMDAAIKLPPLYEHDLIKSIAKAHNVSPFYVLLRWSTQQGIAVIPKVNIPDLMKQNLDHVDFNLTEEELKKIDGLDRHYRCNEPVNYFPTDKLYIFG